MFLHIFFTGDISYWNIPLTEAECFFHASIFICVFFKSSGLERVVSSESETFEPRDRDRVWFERDIETDRDETETKPSL